MDNTHTYADIIAAQSMPVPWLEVMHYCIDTNKQWRPEWANGADAKVAEEFARYDTAADFYRETEVYIYQNLGYALEGIKRPYISRLLGMTPNMGATILDYGCGIGQDGLMFEMLGYPVSFADVHSRTLDYLRWRLARRGTLKYTNVYCVGDCVIPPHDIVWCMDVLEHLPSDEHEALLVKLGSLGNLVFVNLVDDRTADGGLHHPVDVKALTAFVSERWKMAHSDHYAKEDGGGVRLLVYGDAMGDKESDE